MSRAHGQGSWTSLSYIPGRQPAHSADQQTSLTVAPGQPCIRCWDCSRMQPASPGLSKPGIFITDMRKQANTRKLRVASHDSGLPFPLPPPGADLVPFLIFRCPLQPEAELAVLPRVPSRKAGCPLPPTRPETGGDGSDGGPFTQAPSGPGGPKLGVGLEFRRWIGHQSNPGGGQGGSSVQLPGSRQSQSVTGARAPL